MTAIHVNAHALARYAALCQAAQIVPIVEPEVLMDGDHDIDRCYEVTQRVLNKTFQELRVQRVALEGMILKPNMVDLRQEEREAGFRRGGRGKDHPAAEGLRAGRGARHRLPFRRAVRRGRHRAFDAMNRIGGLPWQLTFSYGRALQAAPQKAWSGKAENVAAGQRAFTHRARMNSLASKGEWKADLEEEGGIDWPLNPFRRAPCRVSISRRLRWTIRRR